jgi:hypothetical protein
LVEAAGYLAGRVRKFVPQGTIGDGNAVINGGAARPRLQDGLKAHIVQQRRFGKITFTNVAGVMNTLPPPEKVQQVMSIDAQGYVSQAAHVLAVEIAVDPSDLPACSLFDDTNWALCMVGRE